MKFLYTKNAAEPIKYTIPQNLNLGFKFRRVYNRSQILLNLEMLIIDLKQGFLRMFRGFDDRMYWDMCDNLTKLIVRLLLEFSENSYGYGFLPEWKGKKDTEIQKLWRRYLISTAGNFYRSLEDSECAETFNKYENAYLHSIEIDFETTKSSSTLTFVPVKDCKKTEKLEALYRKREKEISDYRENQRNIGFKKLMRIYPQLWD
ncbi:MAG: hypothetical protein LBM87_02005 [Ruminococcus sp.]|jgi:hypothetical protein|nr:hypothetical protein [Ruminococcus sp.]